VLAAQYQEAPALVVQDQSQVVAWAYPPHLVEWALVAGVNSIDLTIGCMPAGVIFSHKTLL